MVFAFVSCAQTTDPSWMIPKERQVGTIGLVNNQDSMVIKTYDMHGVTFVFKASGVVGAFQWSLLVVVSFGCQL